jgi:hypothetical protein
MYHILIKNKNKTDMKNWDIDRQSYSRYKQDWKKAKENIYSSLMENFSFIPLHWNYIEIFLLYTWYTRKLDFLTSVDRFHNTITPGIERSTSGYPTR